MCLNSRSVFRRVFPFALAAVFAAMNTSCGGSNYFTPMSAKNTDEALYEDMLKMVDSRDWDGALAKYDELSDGYKTNYEVIKTLSGIHAGKCGLDFLAFTSGMSGGSGGAFSTFMSGFTNLDVDMTECQASQTVLETSFGNTALARVANLGSTKATEVNMFLAILGAVKIGAQLRVKADANQDGSIDAGYDSCSSGKISDNEVIQVGTGLALILTNFSTIASTLGGNADAISDLSDACDNITPNPCTITDPANAAWTAPVTGAAVIKGLRGVIKSSSMGIEGCGNADVFTCCP